MELRHAADGQRVLHAVATVALKHGAVLQNGADVGRGVDLVGVRAHGHQALVHSHQRTLEHLERERARNVCRQAERLRVIDRKRRERGDGRGAGEQDKAFFGRKHNGLESRALERLCAVKRFTLMGGLALADHHHADVALERQIADRAVAGDDGADAALSMSRISASVSRRMPVWPEPKWQSMTNIIARVHSSAMGSPTAQVWA